MTHVHTIAAFDLGIKNLSYCIASFDVSGTLTEIHRWTNMNLLAGGAESQTQTRCSCGGPASFCNGSASGTTLLCKKCAKRSSATKPVLDFATLTTRTNGKPVLAEWRVFAVSHLGVSEPVAKKLKKTDIEALAATKFLMPYKAPKVKNFSLQQLLAGMETCLTTEIPHIVAAGTTLIRIENQPSDFAPHMKSVQIMLFTLLDHRIRCETPGGWSGKIEFANASVKTRGTDATVGKDGKRSRKLAAIEKVYTILKETPHRIWWQAQAKQDDLADAFLMCLDGARKV